MRAIVLQTVLVMHLFKKKLLLVPTHSDAHTSCLERPRKNPQVMATQKKQAGLMELGSGTQALLAEKARQEEERIKRVQYETDLKNWEKEQAKQAKLEAAKHAQMSMLDRQVQMKHVWACGRGRGRGRGRLVGGSPGKGQGKCKKKVETSK